MPIRSSGPADLPLGKPTPCPEAYDPSVLVGIPRDAARRALGLTGRLPFTGVDLWNAYELSWLDPRGKPVAATAELRVPATSPQLVESKSLKLYLNSLNATRQESVDAVRELITRDVGRILESPLQVRLTLARESGPETIGAPEGTCIDDAEVAIDTYEVQPELLTSSGDEGDEVEETLFSHLLKTNCPVTGQPDWATLILRYRGQRIDHAALLRYLVSYRNHDDFHENCVERIFVDVKQRCRPRALSVQARYIRRGGIDINPFRTDSDDSPTNARAWRQ